MTTTPEVRTLRPGIWPATAEQGPDGVLSIGGVPVTDIAERYGTPAYVFDEADFRERCTTFREAFHDFDVYYAGKAFLTRTSARIAEETGLSLDVCTEGELAYAKAVDFPAERVLLHGNNKSEADLAAALAYGVGRIVVDSVEELDRLEELVPRFPGSRPGVLLRVTVGVQADTHAHIATAHEDQKFGFSLVSGDAEQAVRRVADSGLLELRGLHSHIGSQILGTAGFEAAAKRLAELRARLAQDGIELPELDLGGGFGIAYTEHDVPTPAKEMADSLRAVVEKECAALGVSMPRLAIEPGRAIAGPAGVTLYRVGTVKHREGIRTFVAVDGGMSDNVRTALYDATYSVQLAGRVSDAPPTLVRVVGKHCDAGDVVVREDHLPSDVRAGDLLAVPGTGAYCRSLAHNYNQIPRPPVIAVAEGRSREIVRRETVEDLMRLDVG
ncbi:diaminopimelate decarboxylase [Streptomyces sp. NBC_01433]|uniref:diaminopimelate decarboxylase n=1 Tax=Streptomyces sp. NBC_01433 TaxID=2903864 RepID=UPI00225C0D34|nr:diaminopimelate decarboxylase [Streptomyces sp. NBC_01433]MCX4675847.1 diaminopimelate decarboxylase [Streptomyces sp. NBC_01433]